MELTSVRTYFTPVSTISKLAVDGVFECYILEDTCREDVPGTWKPEMKQATITAIPYGRYRVVLTLSNRFKRVLPEVLNVPNFEGVRIHPGNNATNTEGCLLPGQTRDIDWVGNSGAAFGPLYRKLETAAARGEKIWLEVTK